MSSRAAAARGKAAKAAKAPAAPAAPKFSDKNASWLKSVDRKRKSLFEDEEEDGDEEEYDDEEEGEEYEDDEDDEGEGGEEDDDDDDEEDGEEVDDDDMGEDDDDGEEAEEGYDDDSEEDEDEDEELDFERKARETVARMERDAAANDSELREQIKGERILPTAEELEEEAQRPPDISALRDRVKSVVEVLSDFAERREDGRPRGDYVSVLANDLATVYGYSGELVELLLGLFSPAEALQFIESSETPRPVTVRTNTLKTRRRELAQALIARNVNLDPIAKWSKEGLQVYESAVPIGATPEYLAGHYMVQSASSFLPVMALQPQPGHRVLDMAASPGGKSSHIAALMANTGTLVANDSSKDRLRALQANLSRLGVRNAIVLNADGRDFPKLMGGFDRVLLDAPCSGLGVISKDPAVKAEKGYADIQRCQQLQKELLLSAIDACNANAAGGGVVVYSTCSISVEENEAVVEYALRSRSVKVVDTGLPFGVEGLTRHRSKRFQPSLKLARRFYPHAHNMDGFFVCKLRKFSNALPTQPVASGGGSASEGKAPNGSAAADGKKAKAAVASGKKDLGGKKKPGAGKMHDPAKSPGPAPQAGSARPGGGTHGDGEKARLKRIKHAKLEIRRRSAEGKKNSAAAKQRQRKKARLE